MYWIYCIIYYLLNCIIPIPMLYNVLSTNAAQSLRGNFSKVRILE